MKKTIFSIVFLLIGSIYVLLTGSKIEVSKKGKFATVSLFVIICLFVINSSITVPFISQLAIVVIIFYFYVAQIIEKNAILYGTIHL